MHSRSLPSAALALALLAGWLTPPLAAQVSARATRVASGLQTPDALCAPDGDFGRLFIVEQGTGNTGNIRVLDLTQNPPLLRSAPYLSVAPIVAGNEEGLLGLAFHPDFANNGYLYVYYTNAAGDDQVVRYQANQPYLTSLSADPNSASEVLTISHPVADIHNGGWIAFGPDGYLHIGTGDGGPGPNSQDLGLRLGKLLRIDVDADDYPADPTNNFAIPPANPFLGTAGALPEIWHYGLRNPWRASFDRATGDLWVGDVGAAAFEEIEFIPAGVGGLNFGWDCMEGSSCTGVWNCVCPDPTLTDPVYSYTHTGGNCCIIGGARYRGAALCDYQGLYFFADFCSGRVWTLEWNGSGVQNLTERTAELAAGGGGAQIILPTSFGEDAAGELYVCTALGDLFRIEPATIVDCNGNGTHDTCDIANETSHDWNADGLPDDCQPVGTPGCFGDGTLATPCPCANYGTLGRGCDNSDGTGGARIEAAGVPALDSVVLISSGERPQASTILLQGSVFNTAGIPFGDGVRCVAGILKRLYLATASGGVAYAPGPGEPPITVRSTARGDPLTPGSGLVRHYQAYYRDPSATFCPGPNGAGWNVSSLVTISW